VLCLGAVDFPAPTSPVKSPMAAGLLTEVVFEIFGSRAQALAVSGKASKRGLLSAAVFAIVVDVSQPRIEGLIEIGKTLSAKSGEKVNPGPLVTLVPALTVQLTPQGDPVFLLARRPPFLNRRHSCWWGSD
jgi:hypothetical protein